MLMRIFLSIMLFTPLGAWAGCDYDIAELSSKGLYISISTDCVSAATIDVSYKVDSDLRPVQGSVKSYPLNDECELPDQVVLEGFSCRKGGHTPLAGATYKLVRGKGTYDCSDALGDKDTPHMRYACVAGCGASVPKYLEKPDSCD